MFDLVLFSGAVFGKRDQTSYSQNDPYFISF